MDNRRFKNEKRGSLIRRTFKKISIDHDDQSKILTAMFCHLNKHRVYSFLLRSIIKIDSTDNTG